MDVLFVDDEELILKGVQRTIGLAGFDWNVRYATSGRQAIAFCEAAAPDIIISDMRMPGMDGARLLKQVQQRWPSTLRVILSGHADEEMTIRALDVAHQYLTKPCDLSTLETLIEHCAEDRQRQDDASLVALVGQFDRLPVAPRSYLQLQALLTTPGYDLGQVTALIEHDVALAANVLRLANSAYFRANAPISDVHTAVVRLGLSTIRTLILICDLYSDDAYRDDPVLARLRGCAIEASIIAATLMHGTPGRDVAMTAALLADIGRMLMHRYRISTTDRHAEVGAYLLSTWGMPDSLVDLVRQHHSPRWVDDAAMRELITVTHIAVCVANAEACDSGYLLQLGNRADALLGLARQCLAQTTAIDGERDRG